MSDERLEAADLLVAVNRNQVTVDVRRCCGRRASAPVFDPWQEPPVQPLVDGDRTRRDWGALLLWGPFFGANVREGRGATKPEVVHFAKRAGYADGRGWNKCSGWKEDEDGRWVTPAGVGHIRHCYAAVSRSLPSDLAEAADRLSE